MIFWTGYTPTGRMYCDPTRKYAVLTVTVKIALIIVDALVNGKLKCRGVL